MSKIVGKLRIKEFSENYKLNKYYNTSWVSNIGESVVILHDGDYHK